MHTTHPLCSKPPLSYGAHGFLKHVKTRECQAVYSSQSWAKPQIRRPGWPVQFPARPGLAHEQNPKTPGPARPMGRWGSPDFKGCTEMDVEKGLAGRNSSGWPRPARRPMGRWVGPGLPKDVGPARPRAVGLGRAAGAGQSSSDSSPLRCLFSPRVPR